jgi:hypothetical protein
LAASASSVAVQQARVVLTRLDGTTALDTTTTVSSTDSTVDLNLTVVVLQAGEVFRLTISLLDAVGVEVFRAGPVDVTPSESQSGAPVVEASFTYTGVGADAAEVVIMTPYPFLPPGDTVVFEAAALDDTGGVIEGAPIEWSSGNQFATVLDAAAGLVEASTQTGQAMIIAALPTGLADTVYPSVQFRSGNVLIVSNAGYAYPTFLDTLAAEMPSITFDTIDVSSVPPTLAFLQQFPVVLVFEDGIFDNAKNVGDTVAAYVAAGGNVVIGTFFWQEQPSAGFGGPGWGLLDSIEPFQTTGGSEYNADSLDATSVVAHPLTTGVDSLWVNSYHGGVTAKPGTTVLATWSDGVPLIGYQVLGDGQRLVSISVYPNYSYYGGFGGDFYRLWENAFLWVGGGAAAPPPVGRVARPSGDVDADRAGSVTNAETGTRRHR